MNLLTRKASFFSRNNHPPGCRNPSHQEEGYALIALMIMATVLLISLAAVLPSIYQEAQRGKEQELIFRGTQYARAIYLFQAKMGRYPASVKELLDTNGVRFLRQAYRDPMTPSGKWRFIHATASGILIDSRTQNLTPPAQNGTSGGLGGSTFTNGQSSQNNLIGQSNPSSQASPGSQAGQPNQSGTDAAQKPSPDCTNALTPGNSSPAEEPNSILGTFIVGVASCSDHPSIIVYNKKSRYSDWEFLGTTYVVMGIPGAPPAPAMNPGQPALPGGQGPGSPATSPSDPGTSSTGFGQPTGVQDQSASQQ